MKNPLSLESFERGLLVQTYCGLSEDIETAQSEFISLTKAAGIVPVQTIVSKRSIPEPKYYIGSGKTYEIQALIETHKINIILINHQLSPRQIRNLESFLKCRVMDFPELVLNIFAQRARSFEGKLQVSLAQLQHLSTRLIRGWTHLERQKGGIGLRGGPGETQLETDRRLIRNRIKTIKAKLEKVKQQRSQNRQMRKSSHTLLIALVGYTNAGKSTLFNYLTQAKSWVASQLFATLDPLVRKIYLNEKHAAVLADTVGFIRQLPTELIEAFTATLEEVREADLLLHVVDASNPQRMNHIETVNQILEKINASHIPQIVVYNKIDSVVNYTRSKTLSPLKNTVWISCKTEQGFSELNSAIIERLKLSV